MRDNYNRQPISLVLLPTGRKSHFVFKKGNKKQIIMVERSDQFWLRKEHELSTFETGWYKEKVNQCSADYSMGGKLENNLERTIGNHLVLAGPVMDSYLEEIGKGIHAKLSRGKLTGLAPPLTIFIPWQIMRHLAGLCTGYHCDIKNICYGKSTDRLIIFIEKPVAADKIFCVKRFNGMNYLAKRFFKKEKTPGDGKLTYNGCAKVRVSISTPIRLEYKYSVKRLQITFFIQRYDTEDFATDVTLQKMINDELQYEDDQY